jgi:YegS/Rv2252/BmrU family lipid kinase
MEDNKTLIIINFKAARAREAWRAIDSQLKLNNIRFDSHVTTWVGNATEATRKALHEGYDTIAVIGGDGTLSETAEGFFEFGMRSADCGVDFPKAINPNAVIAILPSGTGDDFARGLSGLRETRTHWVDRFVAYLIKKDSALRTLHSALKTVDLLHGVVDDGAKRFISINMASIGFSAEVVRRVNEDTRLKQKLSGEARFVLSAVTSLAMWKERRVRVRVDDEGPKEFSSNLLGVANNRFAGGGMMFAPDAKVDDGMFDVLLTHDVTRLAIVRELRRIRSGRHLENPNIEIRKAKKFVVETVDAGDSLLIEADGNLRGRTPAEFRVMPKALKVVF